MTDLEKFNKSIDDLREEIKDNPDKAKEFLMRVGIIDSDGKLTAPYKS